MSVCLSSEDILQFVVINVVEEFSDITTPEPAISIALHMALGTLDCTMQPLPFSTAPGVVAEGLVPDRD